MTLRRSGEANDTGESFDSWTMLIEVITNEEFDACYCIVKKAFKILSDFVYKTNLDSKYDSRPNQIKVTKPWRLPMHTTRCLGWCKVVIVWICKCRIYSYNLAIFLVIIHSPKNSQRGSKNRLFCVKKSNISLKKLYETQVSWIILLYKSK